MRKRKRVHHGYICIHIYVTRFYLVILYQGVVIFSMGARERERERERENIGVNFGFIEELSKTLSRE
jgi:hypothetical protein